MTPDKVVGADDKTYPATPDLTHALSLLHMDTLFARYLVRGMAEKGLPAMAVNEAVVDCATRLTNVAPAQALDEKMAIYSTYGSAYISDSLREAFSAELQLPWAPTAELEERWRTLPEHVQDAYLRQGRAAYQIFGGSSPGRRSESPIRKTLHHPLIYFLAFVVVAFASTANGHDISQILGEGIGAAIVVWFLTAFLP